jgi:hypothetical protein
MSSRGACELARHKKVRPGADPRDQPRKKTLEAAELTSVASAVLGTSGQARLCWDGEQDPSVMTHPASGRVRNNLPKPRASSAVFPFNQGRR